jgi:hypothetical protein
MVTTFRGPLLFRIACLCYFAYFRSFAPWNATVHPLLVVDSCPSHRVTGGYSHLVAKYTGFRCDSELENTYHFV